MRASAHYSLLCVCASAHYSLRVCLSVGLCVCVCVCVCEKAKFDESRSKISNFRPQKSENKSLEIL